MHLVLKGPSVLFGDKTVLVYDYGLFVELAIRLTRDFGRVLYYVPWKAAYPRSNTVRIGTGIEGVERVIDFWDVSRQVDFFVFPDVYDGDLQLLLRSQGARVWGCGAGEVLELDRWWMKERLRELGLPVAETKKIVGLKNLEAHLTKVENKWIKTSKFRGDMETFEHVDFPSTRPWIDELRHSVGPYHTQMEFIVEDDIPGVEIGYDGFSIDGNFAQNASMGYEIKDAGYVGRTKMYDDLPDIIKTVNEKLSGLLRHLQFRGFFSTEIRVGQDGKPYLIDPCSRMGSPPGELFMEWFENLAEVLWGGAEGVVVEPKYLARFGVELLLSSEWAKTNWQEVRIPKGLLQWVKLRNLTVIESQYYVIPQYLTSEIGAVIGFGETLDEAIEVCKKRAEKVKGYLMSTQPQALDEGLDQIKKGRRLSVGW